MSSEPEMSDAQFTNVFSLMIGGLILLTIALIILGAVIASGVRQSDINAQVRDTLVAERIEPAGRIAVGDAASGSTAASGSGETEVASGDSVYQSSCVACHASGVAGAPVFGDAGAWSGRIEKGLDTLYQNRWIPGRCRCHAPQGRQREPQRRGGEGGGGPHGGSRGIALPDFPARLEAGASRPFCLSPVDPVFVSFMRPIGMR